MNLKRHSEVRSNLKNLQSLRTLILRLEPHSQNDQIKAYYGKARFYLNLSITALKNISDYDGIEELAYKNARGNYLKAMYILADISGTDSEANEALKDILNTF